MHQLPSNAHACSEGELARSLPRASHPVVCGQEQRSFPIDPAVPITISADDKGRRTYVFKPSATSENAPSAAEVRFVVSEYTEEVEMLDSVLVQYAEVSDGSRAAPPPYETQDTRTTQAQALDGKGGPPPPPPTESGMHIDHPALRGRLVLMDESSGEVVGSLPSQISFKEDPAIAADDKLKHAGEEAGPVVVELPPEMYDAYTNGQGLDPKVLGEELLETREVFVRAIPQEEQDWMTTSATVVSQVISGSTSLLLTGISSASSYYIKHSKPYTPPPPPSHPISASTTPDGSPNLSTSGSSTPVPRPKTPTPHPALTQAHYLSDKAAKASAVTATYVERFIRQAVGGKDTAPPPLPAPTLSPTVPTNYSVYKPKPRATPTSSLNGSPIPPDTVSPHVQMPQPQMPGQAQGTGASSTPPPPPPRKPLRTRDRVLLSANLILATVDDSAKRMFDVSSERLGAVIGHKYGPQAQQSTHLATHTARNVVLVYVDVSGFARRALITKTGKEFVKARVGSRHPPTNGTPLPPPPPSHPSLSRSSSPNPNSGAANGGGWVGKA
ncbi:hypothetical protein EIP91_005990 [Steccherinum ochraceum]|uniref:Senescence domain-containing protein n=1 Tax=Steccherinum ochraceum TaxID=92696 RepID=A0A4R0RHA0_9APHY|nr:hypothetical protein EIP91_005990 [Steccherinum ochraceum]